MKKLCLILCLLPFLLQKGFGASSFPKPPATKWSRVDDSIFHVRFDSAIAHEKDVWEAGESKQHLEIEGRTRHAIGNDVAKAGRLFLGTPYVAGTIDRDSTHENLVIDLHEFDCVTFYENAMAFAESIEWSRAASFNDREYTIAHPDTGAFEVALTSLRYRDGMRNGFHSRLHYTTDYFYDNEKRGNFINETKNVGGAYVKKDARTIDFMTKHRASYKQLAHDDVEFAAMKKVERDIHARGPFEYIPKESIAKVEGNIRTGDILGITTNIDGLDCSHTGIAVKMPDGRIHFMHASSLMGKVIISDEPLAEYLTHSSHQTGIIVMRPLNLVYYYD